MLAASILKLTPSGLYCEEGDFFIDPVRKVARAVITHGHSDHARSGHEAVLATKETLDVMAARYGDKFTKSRQPATFNTPVKLGSASVTLKPAGHVIGSAQVIVEVAGKRIVVSGDYKREADPTCPAFEPVTCDIFVSEATFGLPIFRHPPPMHEIARLLSSLKLFPDRAHFIAAYSLGKAQRIIAMLRQAGFDQTVFVDANTAKLCAVYEANNIALGKIAPLEGQDPKALLGQIVIAPPSARATLGTQDGPGPITSFASGWMRVRNRARQSGGDLPLIISDHADWTELTRTAEEVAPQELWITHGEEQALITWAAKRGMTARPLRIAGYGAEGGSSQ